MFPLDVGNVGFAQVVLSTSEESKLWHRRFKHLNLGTLQLLAQRQLVKDLPNIAPSGPCEGCSFVKQAR